MRSFPLILPALLAVTGMHSWAQTTEDGFLPRLTGTVRCVTAMPNGKLWVGGEITQVNSTSIQNLTCLQWDGTVAKTPAFDTDGAVLCLLPMADNSLWVGGAFSEVTKHPRARLARLREVDSTVLLDYEFAPEFDGEVRCLLADGDGVLVGGNFTRVNGLRRAGVVRILENGEVDPAFDAKLEGELGITVNAMARQPDEKIVLGGLFDMAGNQAVTNLVRLYPGGALDSRFLGSADGEVHAIGVQADSDIVIGGDFLNASGSPAAKLARLNRLGGFANTLDGFDERVSTIGIQPDGRVLVGGRFGPVAGTVEGHFVRLTADLQIEKSDARVAGEVFCCMPQSDGRILVGGSFTRADTKPSFNLARLDSSMRGDVTVGSRSGPLGGAVSTAVQQPDEKLIFGGTFTGFGGFSAGGFIRTDSSIGRDTTFSSSTVGFGVTGIQVRRDQKLFAYGSLTTSSRKGIARLSSSGTFDQGFNPFLSAGEGLAVVVSAIADQPDDQLLLGGNFTTVNQSPALMIAKVTSNGGFSKAVLPTTLKAAPTDLVTSPTGELTIAGMFIGQDQVSSSPYVRRYAPNGTVISSYALSAEAKVNGMCRLPDGDTLVWGLRPLGGEGNLVRLGVNGKVDSSFFPYFNGEVRSVSVQADGSMLVVGAFTSYRGGGVTSSVPDGFVHVGPDLRRNTSSATSMSPIGLARAGLVQADGKFLFWGGFTSTKGASRPGLARLSTVVPASQELNIVSDEQSSPKIFWQRSGSAPEVERVWFSTSTNGVTYGTASEGRWVKGGWELDKFSATAGHPLWIRAEGRVPSTGGGDAGGLVQSIRQVFLEGEIDVELNENSLISGEEDEVDFGRQIQGVPPVRRTFTITNRGNDWLRLGEPVVPEGFIAGALSTTHLRPGGQTIIEVTSDLSRVGAWTGELVIPSNDLDENEFVIPLKSEALTPLRTTLLKPRAVLNRKTGLREQSIRVRNAAGITYAGFRVIVSGLPQGVEVRNANTELLPDGRYMVTVNQPLGPFANTDLKLEYFFPPKTPAKLTPRISTEVILVPAAE